MAAPEVGGQGGGITEDLRAFFKQRSNAQNLTDFAMGATLGERAALRSARAHPLYDVAHSGFVSSGGGVMILAPHALAFLPLSPRSQARAPLVACASRSRLR